MIKFINERELAEGLLNDKKLINDSTLPRIRAYIKLLKQKGMSKTDIRNEIDNLMLEYYSGFVMGDWDDNLRKMVNKYTKTKNCEFREVVEKVFITKEELNVITSIGGLSGFESIEIEKILFVMLVLAKANNGIWISYTSNDMFKLARFKYKARTDKQQIQREKLIYDLSHFTDGIVEGNVINVTNFGKQPSIKLNFVSEEDGENVLEVDLKEIDNVILKYLNWRKKDGYNYCQVCGKEIVSKAKKPTKYCSKCAKIVKQQQINECKKRKKLNME